jgi:hypothetical protein
MNVEILKRIRIERYIFAGLMAFVMILIAELSGEREIIFPEICALTIGAWISEQQPWVCNKRKMFFLVSIASLFGMLVTRYLPIPLIFQTCLCFAFTGFILTITKTTLIPIISACILPVYLGTKSWVYPISVTIMALMIITAQWLMEKNHLKPKNEYIPCKFDYKYQIIKWSKLLIVFAILALIPFENHQIYFLAPPLIVTFAEFANPKSPMRNKPFHIIGLMTLASATGCMLREVLNLYLHLPLTICAALACCILFVTFDKVKTLFPPAGAILLIPMILKTQYLMTLPFEVCIGATVLIFTAKLLFRD